MKSLFISRSSAQRTVPMPCWTWLIGVLVVLASSTRLQATDAPNVIVILADDLGYGDLSCYNSESKVPTPHIDRLAASWMRFLDAHSPSTVCTPTRYGLLTGQMPFRIPRGGTVFTGVGGPSLIQPNQLTLASLLKSNGYATACVGKWHVGLTFFDDAGQPVKGSGIEAVQTVDFNRPIAGGPLDCGFDRFFGTACCPTTDWLYAYIDGDRIPIPPTKLLDKSRLPKHPYANDCRRGMIAPDFDLEEVDLVFLKKSQEFIENHIQTNPEQPFFLFHSMQAVHLPSFAAKPYQGRSNAGPHGDFLVEMDDIVGELMATLERLQVADNTIVIFTSDNGPEVDSVIHMRQDHQHDGARPWRGIKRDQWEGGHRVPWIARWPEHIPAGQSSAQTMCHTDLMATLIDLVGLKSSQPLPGDSFNLAAAWRDATISDLLPYLLTQAFGGRQTLAILQGDWKYIDHPGSGGNRYDRNPGLQPFQIPETVPDAKSQLYNLRLDPEERHNLVLEQSTKAAELKDLLEQLKRDPSDRNGTAQD